MKSLKEYIAEATLLEDTPSIGDVFEIEIAREEIVLESTVVGYMDDGVVIEADDTMMKILMHVGYLSEDSHMPTARDGVLSPIHSNANRDMSKDDDLEEAETPQGWGQDTITMRDGSVMKYDPKSNSYSMASGPTVPDTKTSMSVVQTSRSKSTDSNKTGPTYSQEYTSTSLARDPKTGAGDYHITRSTGDDNHEEDYQQNVSKPWMDYTFNKAQQNADVMFGKDTAMPQAPMTQFRATNEAEYHGRTVPLGKPMAGDVKKSKVYVKNAKRNVVKVNFGDPNMTIKKSNPKRRKSFRARHNCANPGPRTSARYRSCRAW